MKNETKKRQQMYERTGNSYEVDRYGDCYKELYRQIRNETLSNIINQRLENKEPLRVLEIGCGTGLTLSHLASMNANMELHGLDFSPAMLSQAHQKLNESENSFGLVRGNVFTLPFNNESFDIVYSTRFIHQFKHEDKRIIYKEMSRILKPGGLTITEFYTPHNKLIRSIRGEKEDPLSYQCPSSSEVFDLTAGSCKKWPVRIVGLQAIYKVFGLQTLKWFISMTDKPVISMLREEYFVVTTKG